MTRIVMIKLRKVAYSDARPPGRGGSIIGSGAFFKGIRPQ